MYFKCQKAESVKVVCGLILHCLWTGQVQRCTTEKKLLRLNTDDFIVHMYRTTSSRSVAGR